MKYLSFEDMPVWKLAMDIAKQIFDITVSLHSPIDVKCFTKSHDRFLIIDNSIVYHIGASLKDLGKKWFALSKIELDATEMIRKLKEEV